MTNAAATRRNLQTAWQTANPTWQTAHANKLDAELIRIDKWIQGTRELEQLLEDDPACVASVQYARSVVETCREDRADRAADLRTWSDE